MIRVAVAGAAGKMGRALIQAIDAAEELTLGAGFEHEHSSALGQDAGELAAVGASDVAVSSDPIAEIDSFDVVIDFTTPAATLGLAQVCADANKAMVIGTTGFSEEQLQILRAHQDKIAMFTSPNMSLGVNLLFQLVARAAQALGDSVDVEVIEAHHRDKIDAPSGTAVRIGEVLAEALGRDLTTDAVYGRQGITGARNRNTIGFSTIRGGDIVGEHTVLFAAEGERLEITHRAQSRSNFAQGALRAVSFVSGKPPGWYSMDDLLT
jgi:4-hydroxy-tetrahydrodipicolinate reductase